MNQNARQKTIMILGAGTMQIPALTTAKKKLWRVIAMDGSPTAPGANLADIFEPVDLKDTETLLERARHYKETSGLDGVFTAGTDFSVSVAFIAENLGLPGIPVEIAQNATNKTRMRQLFARHGVPSPVSISCGADGLDKLSRFPGSFPVVVKPVDNMGARGVQMIDDPAALKAACEKALRYSRLGEVIIEEFIPGSEFSVDALIYKGRVHACGIADRHIYFPPFFVELGHTFPSCADKKILDDVEEVFRCGIKALGIDNGAAKGDIFHTGKTAVAGEIAARLSGGYMSGWTCPYAFGVDITAAAMDIAMGLPPGDLTPQRAWTSAERAFISIPGKAAGIFGLDEALDTPGVQDIFTRAEAGAPVKFPENNVEKCGNVITALPDRGGAILSAEKAVSSIVIRLEPGNSETAAFLFGPRPDWQPPAFSLPESLTRCVESLPAYLLPNTIEKTFSLGGFSLVALDCTEAETLTDWNHRGLDASLQSLELLRKDSSLPAWAQSLVLGGVFWQALIRGGVQGALWVLDTLEQEKTAENVEERIKAWLHI
ncbi:MAG: ATP-grasp domain-containing protein [Spirochaetales bacterium]|jgi:biotin carboxylase|nr:ATP-grasp domain-containing protein [Spirochaetales bacterium]